MLGDRRPRRLEMTAPTGSLLVRILSLLRTADVSFLVRIASAAVPFVFDPFRSSLDMRQRKAIDRVMPPGKGKQIYVQMVDTPTPPVVIGLAQPFTLEVMGNQEIERRKIRGVRLTVDDMALLAGGLSPTGVARLLWRLRSQAPTVVRILWIFVPLVCVGPAGLRDMSQKLTQRWKPLLDYLARSR